VRPCNALCSWPTLQPCMVWTMSGVRNECPPDQCFTPVHPSTSKLNNKTTGNDMNKVSSFSSHCSFLLPSSLHYLILSSLCNPVAVMLVSILTFRVQRTRRTFNGRLHAQEQSIGQLADASMIAMLYPHHASTSCIHAHTHTHISHSAGSFSKLRILSHHIAIVFSLVALV
jgi:hypothetical protein